MIIVGIAVWSYIIRACKENISIKHLAKIEIFPNHANDRC